MERTNSVIRISRGRLAALLAATVLVSIALFSLIFYHWSARQADGGPHPGGRPPVGL